MKFELTTESIEHYAKKLFRIRAPISFGDVPKGDLGGFIEKESNLLQFGDVSVSGNSWVSDRR